LSIFKILLDLFFGQIPLCGELDTRPLLFRLHYFYYAIFLFIFTLFTASFTSLLTRPIEKYRLVRTTFWTRKLKTVRPDENEIIDAFELNISVIYDFPEISNSDMNVNDSSNTILLLESNKKNIFEKIYNFLFASQTVEFHSLNQTKIEIFILNLNLILILSISVGIFIFFSIPIHY